MPYQLPNGSVYPAELLRQRAQEAAQRRREYREATRDGVYTLEELLTLAQDDIILARTRLKTVLSWLSGVGAVKTRRILDETHITSDQRLRSLSRTQRACLLGNSIIVQHAAAIRHRRRISEAG
jgi:hypothetical protein